jgi:TM2 domain-containing membrane protein YozV
MATHIINSIRKNFRHYILLILLICSIDIIASDYYVTTADIHIRVGAGTSFQSIGIIEKGDTIRIIEEINIYWSKIEHKSRIGYSSNKYLLKIEEEKIIIKRNKKNKNNYFLFFLIVIVVLIIAAQILYKVGKTYRNKTLAAVLSLTCGWIGLQKFYLGQTDKGYYSLAFCWTFIPLLIGVFDFIKYTIMNEKMFNSNYNKGLFIKEKNTAKSYNNYSDDSIIKRTELNSSFNERGKVISKKTTPSKPSASSERKIYSNHIDQTIIDVNSEKLNLSINNPSQNSTKNKNVPYWKRTYVYSYDEINNAAQYQKEFYFFLRENFLKGEFVDIQENTNYAFVLYFDLLNEYESHKDTILLERQFKLLGEICPNTKNYTLPSLLQILRQRNDEKSILQLKELQEPVYQFEQGYLDFDPDEYKLGKQYKEKLGLCDEDVEWLNKFWYTSNVFISNEGCCIATIKQYLIIIKELEKNIQNNGTSLSDEVATFKDEVQELYDGQYGYDWGHYEIYSQNKRTGSDIFLSIFKRVENSVRESYRHKRKVTGMFPYSNSNLSDSFEKRIGESVNSLIIKYKDNIEKPDIETQIVLNSSNVNRWKSEFAELKELFQKDKISNFNEGVIGLEETNQKNSNIEDIFYEASKFISKFDKVQSLKYYAKYIYYDLISRKFDNKQINKTIQKSLFKTDEQLNDFKLIIEELIKKGNIEKALESISKIYIPKRKKIVLDKTTIQEVEQKHNGTVELLNEYLESDIEELNDNHEVEILFETKTKKNSIFVSGLNINEVQEELVIEIAKNSLAIKQEKVEKYALKNGLQKNQLIDSINDVCYEILEGEALIEEEEDNYIIDETYYKEIVI